MPASARCALLALLLGSAASASAAPWPTYDAAAAAAAAATAPRAALPSNFSLASLFSDHMVIQHDQRTPVWGFDVPGSAVTVRINGGNSFSNTTDATGVWRVFMDAHGAGGPHELDVTSTSGGAATLQDVYFGSVYVCGGQSVRGAPLFAGERPAPSSARPRAGPPSGPSSGLPYLLLCCPRWAPPYTCTPLFPFTTHTLLPSLRRTCNSA